MSSRGHYILDQTPDGIIRKPLSSVTRHRGDQGKEISSSAEDLDEASAFPGVPWLEKLKRRTGKTQHRMTEIFTLRVGRRLHVARCFRSIATDTALLAGSSPKSNRSTNACLSKSLVGLNHWHGVEGGDGGSSNMLSLRKNEAVELEDSSSLAIEYAPHYADNRVLTLLRTWQYLENDT